MSSLKFNYQPFSVIPSEAFHARTVTYRPVVDVVVLHQGELFRYRALVDSGADFCVFHADVAEFLHLPVRSGKQVTFYGTGGTPQKAYFHTIEVEIGGWPLELYCGFSFQMKSLPYGLLGQTGFFDRFKVEFDYQNKRMELKSKR